MNFCRQSPKHILSTRLSYLNPNQLRTQKWAVLPPNTNCKWSYYGAREVVMTALCLSHGAACKTRHVYDGKCCMAERAVHHACHSREAPADCSYASLEKRYANSLAAKPSFYVYWNQFELCSVTLQVTVKEAVLLRAYSRKGSPLPSA